MSDPVQQPTHPESGDAPGPGHEPNAIHLRSVAIAVVALVLLSLAAHFVPAWLMAVYPTGRGALTAGQAVDPGSAAHWVQPETDLEQQRRREDEHLLGHRWVDREKGLIRIPIDAAMELLARHHAGLDQGIEFLPQREAPP